MKKFTLDIPVSGRVLACLNLLKKYTLKDKTIIDVGSSFGWLEKEIFNLDKTVKVTGIEPDPEAVKFSTNNVKRAKFLVGDALNLPVKDEYADYATLFDVIEHVPAGTEPIAIRELHRTLKTRGLLFLTTPNDIYTMNFLDPAYYFGHRHYRKQALVKLLKSEGFNILESKIKGGYWFSIYLIWLYITKRLTGNFLPRNRFLEKKEASEFLTDKEGIHTHFIVAQKA